MQLARNAGYGEWNSWSNNPARVMVVRFGADDAPLSPASEEPIACACVAKHIPYPDPDDRSLSAWSNTRPSHFILRAAATVSGLARHHACSACASRLGGKRWPARCAMNGRVVAVNARDGEIVEAVPPLVVLEAMKMEHALSVPAAARVKAVHVTPGAQVSPGQLLAELEPAP